MSGGSAAPPLVDRSQTPSPCTGICRLDDQDICEGCGRTIDEIAGWSGMSAAEQRAVRESAKRRR